MCRMLEEMRDEAAKDAAFENSKMIALNLLSFGTMSHEDIAKVTELPLDVVETLAKHRSA